MANGAYFSGDKLRRIVWRERHPFFKFFPRDCFAPPGVAGAFDKPVARDAGEHLVEQHQRVIQTAGEEFDVFLVGFEGQFPLGKVFGERFVGVPQASRQQPLRVSPWLRRFFKFFIYRILFFIQNTEGVI